MTDDQKRQSRRNLRVLGGLMGLVVGMVGLSFAAVPLYDLFCRVTGYGGTTQVAGSGPDEVLERTVRVRFAATVDRDLPWSFEPEVREVSVRVGEPALVAYFAENTSDTPVAGTAVYNVTPAKSGLYFVKTQCFCFDEQILMPGQRVTMPVYFYVDPTMDDDPNLDDVTTITLHYAFYPTESDTLDEAIEDYYRSIESIGEDETAMITEEPAVATGG